jgi:HSP20 family protein
MHDENIAVAVANGLLTIKGEKREEKDETKKDYHVHERRFGSFTRSFSVPKAVDANKIEATFHDGVLIVDLPKKAEAVLPEKKIEVKSAA